MNYRRDKYANPISALGFGCLRFPQKNGKIDLEETTREIVAAVEAGVNYLDTAYVYSGSEAALGQILEETGLRSRVNIATKLPHYLIKSIDGMEKLFREELSRLRTDHIDYYLMHMLTDTGTWERLKKLGIEAWLEEKKRSGQIRQVGFSYHGNADMFCALVDAYDWDFCQIQYNYLDEHSQAGRKGLHYAHGKGLPVIIMEPLRGGKLVNLLPEEAKQEFAAHSPIRTPAQWAFRWLFDQKEVTCVLSGMNSMEMVLDNIQTACDAAPGELTEADRAMFARVVQAIHGKMKVGCTACGYCIPCPAGVDIPGTFSAYNHIYTENLRSGRKEYLQCTGFRKVSTAASKCIGCGKCERHCPQGIPIRRELKNAASELEDFKYKAIRKVIDLFKVFG